MTISWPTFRLECKTRLSGLSRSLFLGRERWLKRSQRITKDLQDTRLELAHTKSSKEKLEVENEKLREQIARLQQEALQKGKDAAVALPPDVPDAGQQFGPRMMELGINMAREIGIRRAVRALRLFFTWLKLDTRLPSKDTIRCWMQRLGVARMQKTKKLKEAVWLVDETVQIGKEKVLAVLAIDPLKFKKNGEPSYKKIFESWPFALQRAGLMKTSQSYTKN